MVVPFKKRRKLCHHIFWKLLVKEIAVNFFGGNGFDFTFKKVKKLNLLFGFLNIQIRQPQIVYCAFNGYIASEIPQILIYQSIDIKVLKNTV